ncbi:MAG: universal stress protein [Gammaproteobacteria bacterium]|jgi:universal stress protein A
MPSYQHLLVAVDLSEASDTVVEQARAVAGAFNARLSLLHVVEFIPVDPAGEALLPPPVDLEQELLDSARGRIGELARRHGLESTRTRVEIGNIKSEVARVANELGADLIVLGNRERHGLALLLGSTENSVMHAAPCDVLAIRIN